MAQAPQIFHTSQRDRRAFTWGDLIALVIVVFLLYAGVQLAFNAPQVTHQSGARALPTGDADRLHRQWRE